MYFDTDFNLAKTSNDLRIQQFLSITFREQFGGSLVVSYIITYKQGLFWKRMLHELVIRKVELFMRHIRLFTGSLINKQFIVGLNYNLAL